MNIPAMVEADRVECVHPTPEQAAANEKRLRATAPTGRKPIASDCDTSIHAAHNSGTRPLSAIDLVVIHSTEGGTARSNANWFANPASQGSTTLIVDDNICHRTLRDDEIPWGAYGANVHGFHIEQCGYAGWASTMWSSTHRWTLMRAAFKTAFHCKKYGISVRFLTADKLRQGIRNGITTHAECSKAFGGNHTDPGTGWPRLLFMTMVRGYYAALTVRKTV